MSLILLLNPKQYGGAVEVADGADIWRKRGARLRKLQEAEEAAAIQILLSQHATEETALGLSPQDLAGMADGQEDLINARVINALRAQVKSKAYLDRLLLLIAAMDD